MPLVTFGDVKAELAECTENGVLSTDPRVLTSTNAAMRALVRAMPRGIFVGSTDFIATSIDSTGVFALPSGYDVALAIEVPEDTQQQAGWIDLLSRSTFVAPEDLLGSSFYDLGTNTAGVRSYQVANLPAGVTTLGVSALKAFVKIVDDTTPLFVQNVEAIKYWLLSLYFGQRADNLDQAEKYQARAVQELTSELQRHLDDPSRYAIRMAHWQYDAKFLPDNSLGRVTARMALDFAAGQKIGRVTLYRVVDEASRQATEMYNDLGKTEQFSNNAGPESIAYTTAFNRLDPLSYPDYETLTLLVRAQGPGTLPEQIPVLKDQAQKLVARNLATKIEAARNVTWQGLMASNPQPQFGGMRAQLGLEWDGGVEYPLSDRFVSRITRQAWAQAVDQFNLISRTEDYEQAALPAPAAVPADTDVVPFPIEVIKLYFEAQICQDRNEADRANAYKQQGAALIQRNLVALVDRQRRTFAETQMTTDQQTAGNMIGRLALELSDGLPMSDAKRRRYVLQAWSIAADQANFLSRTEDYEQAVVALPPTVVADEAGVPFPYEVIKLLVESLLAQDANAANDYKDRAFDLLRRNLVSLVERQRRVTAEMQVLLPINTFGYTKGRLALELDGGLSMSDAKRGRLLNEAEELLSDSGKWKFFESEYILAVASDGTVIVPTDVETIIYAESCGRPIELKDRKWFYRGACMGGNGYYSYLNGGSWDIRANNSISLIYGGPDGCGNNHYTLQACFNGGTIRALCRRKWTMKYADSDLLLVQSYPALKSMVRYVLAKQAGDAGTAEYARNSARNALDQQLSIVEEGQVTMPTVDIAGLPMGGIRGRGYFIGNRY